MFEEEPREKIDPRLMAELDKEIYQLFLLLPPDIQRQYDVEWFRGQIKTTINYVGKIKDKIAIIKEAKDLLKDFPVAERMEAMDKFFRIKGEKESAVKTKMAAAKEKLMGGLVYIPAEITLITLLSMILVLLAIERHTRKI